MCGQPKRSDYCGKKEWMSQFIFTVNLLQLKLCEVSDIYSSLFSSMQQSLPIEATHCPQHIAIHCNSHVALVALLFSRVQLKNIVSDNLSMARWLQQLASPMCAQWTGYSSSQLFHSMITLKLAWHWKLFAMSVYHVLCMLYFVSLKQAYFT